MCIAMWEEDELFRPPILYLCITSIIDKDVGDLIETRKRQKSYDYYIICTTFCTFVVVNACGGGKINTVNCDEKLYKYYCNLQHDRSEISFERGRCTREKC